LHFRSPTSTLLVFLGCSVALRRPSEPPDADAHVGWCGRGERATAPPMPISERWRAVLVSPTVPLICFAAIRLRSNMAESSAITLDFPFWFLARI
jgi:hypothetical protein